MFNMNKDKLEGFLSGALLMSLIVLLLYYVENNSTEASLIEPLELEETEAQQRKRSIKPILTYYIDSFTGCHYLSLDNKTLVQRQSKLGQVGCKRLKVY